MPPALIAALAAATLATLPSLGGPYQFDDWATVATDPGFARFTDWWSGLATHVRPALKASFVATTALGEALGSPILGHRLGNLAIHLAAVVALWHLACQLAERWLPPPAAQRARTTAAWAAALLAVHPLASEAVGYPIARSVSLPTLATALAAIALLRASRARTPGARIAFGLAAGAAAAIAVGSREAAIVALAVCAGVAATLDGPTRTLARRHAAVVAATALALGVAAVLALALHPRYGGLAAMSLRILEARAGDGSFAAALGWHGCVLLLRCYPSVDPLPPAAGPGASLAAAAALLALGLTLAALHRWHGPRPLAMLWFAWAVAWLAPAVALPLRHDVVSDRHAYPALFSVGWAFGAGIEALRARIGGAGRGRAVRALGAAAVALAAAVFALRMPDWRSEVALWEAADRGGPDRPRVLNNLGVTYLEAGRWDDARRVLERALVLAPDDERVQWNVERARRGSRH